MDGCYLWRAELWMAAICGGLNCGWLLFVEGCYLWRANLWISVFDGR